MSKQLKYDIQQYLKKPRKISLILLQKAKYSGSKMATWNYGLTGDNERLTLRVDEALKVRFAFMKKFRFLWGIQ